MDRELLHQIAADLGEEWKRLAQQLNIKRMRIQAIIRNNVEWDTEHVIYEMLITWMKRVPKSANKVRPVCAFTHSDLIHKWQQTKYINYLISEMLVWSQSYVQVFFCN